jgi:glycosyltransferase involved in cell wall biosynthesis
MNPENGSSLALYLDANSIKSYFIKYSSKKDLAFSFIKVLLIFLRRKPAIVHAHLFEASLIGLWAAFFCCIKCRIYTRHHSDLHHVYFPKAVKYDKLCNLISTHIIAVSEVVKEILVTKETVKPEKISIVHHGIDLEKFMNPIKAKVEYLKNKNQLTGFYPVIGVISRYTEWKGIQYIIPAFKNILREYPKACLVLANAKGDYAMQIKGHLSSINNSTYREIEFEADVASLYHCFDIFVHVPITKSREAFGQIYIESMASGIPSVFTLSGIANEIIEDRKNAMVVDYADAKGIEEATRFILKNTLIIDEIIINAKASVLNFSAEKKFSSISGIYQQLLKK